MELLQIVPRLPPAIDGVGDHAYLLARQLRAAHGIHTRFLVCDPNWSGGRELDGFTVAQLSTRTREALLQQLKLIPEGTTILLHYVGYGYAKRGSPIWLMRALELWRKGTGGRKLIVMFHEIAAQRGPLLSSSFLNVPLQRWVAARLARLADKCRTSMQRYSKVLEQMATRHSGCITVAPVFSTIGELNGVPPWPERMPRIVIFGGGSLIHQSLTKHREALLASVRSLNVDKIIIIGKAPESLPSLPIQVDCCGVLPAANVSKLLASCRVGWLSYPAAFLAKSSVFAAYASHGMVTVLPQNGQNEDGLADSLHFMTSSNLPSAPFDSKLEFVGGSAHLWYQRHGVIPAAISTASDIQ